MAWVRTTRITLLIGLLVAGAVLAWLAAHPGLYSGHISRLITRNLLRDTGAAFTCRTISGNPFSDLTFHMVSITRSGDDGSFAYFTADSLRVQYDLRSILRRDVQLGEVSLRHAQLSMRRSPPAPEEPEEGKRPLDFEPPRLGAERLIVDDFSMVIRNADGSLQEDVNGLRWRASARNEGEALVIDTAELSADWTSRDLRLHSLRAVTALRPGVIDVHDAHAVFDSTRARVDMSFDLADTNGFAFTLDGEAESFSLRELFRGLGKDGAPLLLASGECEIDFAGGRMHLVASGEGILERAPFVAEVFDAEIEGERLNFRRMRGRYLGAEGDVSGNLQADTGRLELRGQARHANLADPWTGVDLGWPTSDLEGPFYLVLQLVPPLSMELELQGARGELVELPVDSVRTRVEWNETEGMRMRQGSLNVLGTRLSATGTIGVDEVGDFLVRARARRLAPWAERLELPLDGRGLEAVGRLAGPVDSMALRLGGSLAEWEVGTLRGEENQVVVEMDRFDRFDRLRAELNSTRLLVQGRELGSLALEVDRRAPRTHVRRLEVAVADSALQATGWLEDLAGGVKVEVDSLRLTLGEDAWRLEEPAEVEVVGHRFSTPGLQLTSSTGRIAASGAVDREGAMDLTLQLADADLSLLRRLGVHAAEIDGLVSAALRLEGSVDDPRADLSLELEDGRVGERRVGRLELAMAADGPTLHFDRLVENGPYGAVELEGSLRWPRRDWMRHLLTDAGAGAELWRGAQLDLTVVPDGLKTAHWVDPELPPTEFGRLSGSIRVRGATSRPSLEGGVQVDDLPAGLLRVPRLRTQLRTDAEGLHLTEGTLESEGPWLGFAGRLPLAVSFTDAPRWESHEGLDLHIDSQGEVELDRFLPFWSQLRELEGKGELKFSATGDPRSPTLTGELRLRDARVALLGWSETLRETEVEGTFRDGKLTLTRIEAREGARGRIRGTGEIAFAGLLPDDVSLDLQAERVLLQSVPHLSAIGSSSDLRLRLVQPGPDLPRVPLITGNVVVDKARYTGEFTETGNGAQPEAIGATFAPLWMANLHLRAVDRVQISNQSAELRVQGDVDFIRDTDGLRLRGTVEIPQGRVPLFNNDFTILEGTLDFSRRPVEPEVDIWAETEVPIYDTSGSFGRELERVRVHLTGTFAQPQVAFESDNGLDENTIVRLLAGFGGPEQSGQVTAGLGDVGFRAGLNFLERALAQRISGVDTIDIQTEEAGLDEMGSTRIAVGKYLSDNLYLRFSQGLSVTERDLFLEYQISRRMLFTSELKRRLRENGAENQFNVDLKFRVKY